MHPSKTRDAIIEQLLNSDEVKLHGYKLVKCQACKSPTLDNYYICPACGWEYDPMCLTSCSPSSVNSNFSPAEHAATLCFRG